MALYKLELTGKKTIYSNKVVSDCGQVHISSLDKNYGWATLYNLNHHLFTCALSSGNHGIR
ncbi:hypothetical protein CBR65_12220 [Cellvibrio sp. PSBB006]|nr:hypothetical protein CBR65_12220 [Cellvibrio sp. PSBB006]